MGVLAPDADGLDVARVSGPVKLGMKIAYSPPVGVVVSDNVWQRQGNHASLGTLLPSAVRTGINNLADPSPRPFYVTGLRLYLNITADPGAVETVTVRVYTADPVGVGVTQTFMDFTPITAPAVGLWTFTIYPKIAETAPVAKHEAMAIAMATVHRLGVIHSSSGPSWTYSLSGHSIN